MNYESGAVTRMSCIFSGVLVMVLVLLFAPQANVIPIAALAGTLVHIGLKLVDVVRLRVGVRHHRGRPRGAAHARSWACCSPSTSRTRCFVGIAVSIYYALRRAEGFKLRALHEGDDGSLQRAHRGATGRARRSPC